MTECLKVTKEQRAYDQQSVKYTKELSVTYFTGGGNVSCWEEENPTTTVKCNKSGCKIVTTSVRWLRLRVWHPDQDQRGREGGRERSTATDPGAPVQSQSVRGEKLAEIIKMILVPDHWTTRPGIPRSSGVSMVVTGHRSSWRVFLAIRSDYYSYSVCRALPLTCQQQGLLLSS